MIQRVLSIKDEDRYIWYKWAATGGQIFYRPSVENTGVDSRAEKMLQFASRLKRSRSSLQPKLNRYVCFLDTCCMMGKICVWRKMGKQRQPL